VFCGKGAHYGKDGGANIREFTFYRWNHKAKQVKKRDSGNYYNLRKRYCLHILPGEGRTKCKMMTKEEIISKLETNHKLFADFMLLLSEKDFMYAPVGKWAACQQLDHVTRAVSPLAMGLRLPKFIIKLSFGKANRLSQSYDDLVKKYLEKLERGGKASRRFIPVKIEPREKEKSINILLKLVAQLERGIESYSEKQIDAYILPHPLLGKITIREMMYFTIYHSEHHLKQAKKNIGR
jgi:hypothetical protein